MDLCLPYNKPSALSFSSSQGLRKPPFICSTLTLGDRPNWRPLVVVASSQCEFGSLNTPHEPKSPAGKCLSSVLQNDRHYFHVAVEKQLEQLVADRDQALARMDLSLGTAEESLHRWWKQRSAPLGFILETLSTAITCTWGGDIVFKTATCRDSHRKIAEVKQRECQTAVEDVMYMLIFYKFSEIRVHLVPRLSKCIYNGRLEISPSKDYELESIHSFEVLEMIKKHLTAVVGWRADSNVTDNWATTNIKRLRLCQIYAASILYGYFLKSASVRHHLELSLGYANPLSELWSYGLKSAVYGHMGRVRSTSVGQVSFRQENSHEKLSSYVMGFDPETLRMCAKPKSKEAMNLIEKHSDALFGDSKMCLVEGDEVISTSLASQKRFVLEAVAFGSFLWDSEEYVKTVYKLEEN